MVEKGRSIYNWYPVPGNRSPEIGWKSDGNRTVIFILVRVLFPPLIFYCLRMLSLTFLLLPVIPFVYCAYSQAKAYPQSNLPLSVAQLMSQEQFKRAGLEKLSERELKELDVWLNAFAQRVIQVSQSTVPDSGSSVSGTVIESYITGNFNGWDGETIFQLDNNQIWQQSVYSYRYHYAYHPKVIIFPTSGGFKMKVENVEEELSVRKIR